MKQRRLKRSSEYKAKVREYAANLSTRYRPAIAEAFLSKVEEAEKLLSQNNLAGTPAPYLLLNQQVVLRELYFDSGPVTYCLIYEITEEYVGLISLWHGVGSRHTARLQRIWARHKN